MSNYLYGGPASEGVADAKAERVKRLKKKCDEFVWSLADENGDEYDVRVWYRDNWTRPTRATYDSPAEGGHEIEIQLVEDSDGDEVEITEAECERLTQKIVDDLDDPSNTPCDEMPERDDR